MSPPPPSDSDGAAGADGFGENGENRNDKNNAFAVNLRPSKRAKMLGIIASVLAAAFFIVPVLVSTYTDFQWFRNVDYQSVYFKVIVVRVVLFLVFGALGALMTWLAAFAAYRVRPDELDTMTSSSPLAVHRPAINRSLRPFLAGIPVFAGLMTGLFAQGSWRSFMLFLNGGAFGQTDPQFHKDLGFYAFNLPVLSFTINAIGLLLVAGLFINAMGHYLLGSITTGNPRVGEKARMSHQARKQLAVIAGLWMLSKAVDYWMERYELLTRSHDTFTGAGYTDINAVLPAKIALLVISIFVAALFFFTLVVRDLRVPALAVALMVVSSLTVGTAWPALLEQFSVQPNRAEKEHEYIGRNIQATRAAFGIGDDKVTYQNDWGAQKASNDQEKKQSVGDDEATVSNIRLLDPEVLSPTFTQQQQLRNFYGFADELSIDRYDVNGNMRDFVVAARELNPVSYTHLTLPTPPYV